MSKEITVSCSWSANKGNVSRSASIKTVADMAGTIVQGPTSMSLTTSYASLPLGSISQPAWLWIRNLHATVAAVLTLDGTNDNIPLAAAGVGIFIPLSSTLTPANLMVKSVTNPGEIEYALI